MINTYNGLLILAFTMPSSFTELNKQYPTNSLAHSSIGTPSPCLVHHCTLNIQGTYPANSKNNEERSIGLRLSCKHMVSDTISFPSPGCFSPFPHGTCTLLIIKDIQPYQIVLANSYEISRVSQYSGVKSIVAFLFSCTGLSPSLAVLFQDFLLKKIQTIENI